MRTLVITLLGLAIAGCSGESKTERSGEVIAASGEVRVVRGDADPAPLTVGDRVEGSDRVRTGEDAEVKIKLAHNGVTLVYGGGADVLLSKAPGWTASGDVGSGVLEGDPVDKTSAAGVNSENEAASDPKTALANKNESTEPTTETTTETTSADPPPPPEDPSGPKGGEGGGKDRDGSGGVGTIGASGGGDRANGGGKKGSGGGKGGFGQGPGSLGQRDLARPKPPSVAVTGGSEKVRAIVRRMLQSRVRAMSRCFDTGRGKRTPARTIALVLAVSGGKLLPLSVKGADAKTRGCISAVIRSIPLPETLEAKGLRATIKRL